MRNRAWFAAAVAVVLLLAAPAANAFGKTVQVDKNAGGAADAPACGTGVNTPCVTIGGALNPADGNAGDGDTVNVAAGTYTEQVTITKGVTLHGAGIGQTIVKATSHPLAQCSTLTDSNGAKIEPMICVDHASGPVIIENLTTDASGSGADTNCTDDVEGIYALNSAVTVQQTDEENDQLIPASLGGCQGGDGITIRSNDSTPRTVAVEGNTINHYQKNGITIVGSGLAFTVSGNTVTDQPQSQIAPNGIEVGNAGTGTISNNTVSGNECNDTGAGCGADPINDTQSTGLLLFDNGPVTVSNNTLSGNDIGIFTGNFSNTSGTVNITGNKLTGNRYEGLFAGAGTTNASGNTITGSNIGVENASFNFSSPDPSNAVLNLTDNSITDNGTALQLDVSQSGTNNPVTTAHDNAMTHNSHGIANNTGETVNASDNLITCDAGSGAACVSGSGVTTTPLTLKVTPARAQIGIPNQTTTVTAELVDSAGHVVSGAAVPDGSEIGFAASLGSIPANAPTTGGVATATLTSGSTTGTSVVAAGFDDQAATTSVLFGAPAGPPPTLTITKTKTVTKSLPLIISSSLRASRRGVLSFVAVNPLSSTVSVKITLTIRQHRHTVTVAKRTVRIARHRSQTIRLTLTRAALKTLLKAHKLRVTDTTVAASESSKATLTLTT